MKSYFLRLNAYDAWANRRVLEALRTQDGNEDMWSRLSHVVLAEGTWIARILGQPLPEGGIFQTLAPDAIEQWIGQNEQNWARLLESESDFARVFHYKMLNGTPSESTLVDILAHIFNHGTYHRGQIATLLRQAGKEPVATDFIGFSRLK